mgnify:CR=1 FL=1
MKKIIEFIENNILLEFDENKMPYIKLSRHNYVELMKMLEDYSKEH